MLCKNFSSLRKINFTPLWVILISLTIHGIDQSTFRDRQLQSKLTWFTKCHFWNSSKASPSNLLEMQISGLIQCYRTGGKPVQGFIRSSKVILMYCKDGTTTRGWSAERRVHGFIETLSKLLFVSVFSFCCSPDNSCQKPYTFSFLNLTRQLRIYLSSIGQGKNETRHTHNLFCGMFLHFLQKTSQHTGQDHINKGLAPKTVSRKGSE